MTTSEKALLVAARGGKPSRTPLWLMRQAGRYLPEYRAVREKHDTLTMFTTPTIAADITLQPLRRFDLEAAIVYADILLIPHALGLGLHFVTGEGPKFERTIRTREDVEWLRRQAADPEAVVGRCGYLAETLTRVKSGLAPHQTLIGFCGAPWTVASYMIEGGSAHGEFFHSKMLMLREPALFAELMDVVTDISIRYLRMQVDAGAEILQGHADELGAARGVGGAAGNQIHRPGRRRRAGRRDGQRGRLVIAGGGSREFIPAD